MDTETPDTVIAQTKHLRLVDRGGWSFVQRVGSTGVVCIVATTAGDRLILVEQHRKPLKAPVIELPAGLAGDVTDESDESLVEAARRELLEETGYVARDWRRLAELASSGGLTDEVVTLFRAENLHKEGPGGGEGSEDIRVHEIPPADAGRWLDEAAASGKIVDARVYAGLYFLR